MPAAGLEPARSYPRQILSLMRLPFRHAGVLQYLCNGTILSFPLRFGKHFFNGIFTRQKDMFLSAGASRLVFPF